MLKKKIAHFLTIILFAVLSAYSLCYAYTISFTIDEDPQVYTTGSIVALSGNEYILSNSPYSPDVIGVVTNDPELALVGKEQENLVHVVTIGNTQVRVSGKNGPISQGDYITTSDIPGVGVKVTQSGNAVGKALEAFEPENEDEEGLVEITLDVKDVTIATTYSRNLISLLQKSSASALLYPLDALRYLLAALLVAAAFILGLFSFSRIAVNSVRAIGRNPVAHEHITKETRSSFLLTAIVILVGMGIAYLILAI